MTTEPKFKPGDRVRFSDAGKDRWPDGLGNPHDLDGVILHWHSGSRTYDIKWSTGRQNNSYRDEHLEIVAPPPELVEATKQEVFNTLARLAKAFGFKLVAEDDEDDES